MRLILEVMGMQLLMPVTMNSSRPINFVLHLIIEALGIAQLLMPQCLSIDYRHSTKTDLLDAGSPERATLENLCCLYGLSDQFGSTEQKRSWFGPLLVLRLLHLCNLCGHQCHVFHMLHSSVFGSNWGCHRCQQHRSTVKVLG